MLAKCMIKALSPAHLEGITSSEREGERERRREGVEKLVSWHRLAHIFRFIERQAELVVVVVVVFLDSFSWRLFQISWPAAFEHLHPNQAMAMAMTALNVLANTRCYAPSCSSSPCSQFPLPLSLALWVGFAAASAGGRRSGGVPIWLLMIYNALSCFLFAISLSLVLAYKTN